MRAACSVPDVVEPDARAAARPACRWRWRWSGRVARGSRLPCRASVRGLATRCLSVGSVIVDSAVYRNGARVAVDCAPGDFHDLRSQATERRRLRLGGPARAHRGRARGRRRSRSGCTRWPSRTPSTPTSGRSWSATRTALFLVLKTLWYVDETDQVETGEINIFVGHDFVITVRHGEGGGLQGRAPLARGPRAGPGPRPVRGRVRRVRPGRRPTTRRWPTSSRMTSTRSRRRSSPPSAPATRPGSTCSSGSSRRCAGRCCRCGSRCGRFASGAVHGRPPGGGAVLPRRRRPPRPGRGDGRQPRLAALDGLRRPHGADQRSSRTTTCAGSRPASA